VLVRCYNEIGALPSFWESLRRQTVFERLEIVVLDSGSTDGSLDYMLLQPCSIYQIPSSSFNFGLSCNQLMQLSSAPVAMFLSAHVFLEQSNAAEQVIELLHSESLRAAYFRQVPNAILGFNAYEAAFLKRRFPSGNTPKPLLSPGAFSNAASVLTRAAWLRLQFPEVHGSEDHRWAQEFLGLGGELFYLPQLQVQHSHNENPAEVFRRIRLNVLARGNAGSYFRAIYLFAGIVAQTLRVGGSIKEAVQFAWNHARAYL
jgi:glycosyltransferase involved in cell wall biosynthesis